MPAALRDRPEPYEDLLPVLQAFALLSAVRPVAVGPGGLVAAAIPLAEIRAYCGLFEVGDVEEFVRLIRAMDDAVLARAAEKRPAEARPAETRPAETRPTERHQPQRPAATTGDPA